MSYSFSVRAVTREEVMAKVTAEFDKVVEAQPIHKADRAQAQSAAEMFLGVVPDAAESEDYSVYVSGSVSWNNVGVTSASVHVSASVLTKEPT